MKKWMSIALSVLILFTLSGCAGGGPELPPVEGDAITPVDYSNVNNWMEQAANPSLPVDVFFLYPTTYRPGKDDGVLAEIDDSGMRETAGGEG